MHPRLLVLAPLCALFSACSASSLTERVASRPGWDLIWSDEFDYHGLPDSTRWTYEVGMIRNQELQYYTRDRPENARVEEGMLIIESRKESYDSAAYTSASLTTEGRASWRYGRIEVRAKLPAGRGMWPAIWTLGVNRREVGWPRTGEIDIMESVGFAPDTLYANVHTAAFNHVRGNGKGTSIHAPGMHTDFHVYAVEWFPDRIDFFNDGQKYFTFANTGRGVDEWPFDAEQYLILNAAVGGAWGGRMGVDDAIFPQRYYIDYVRVYRRSE